MNTEHEGSAQERPPTERQEPAQDQVGRMIQDLEKRMATLSDAVLEQSTERAQLSKALLRFSEFAATAGAASWVKPDLERTIALWLAIRGESSFRGEGSFGGEATLMKGSDEVEIGGVPSLDEFNALFERLDHGVAAERVAIDELLKRMRDSRTGK